MGMSRFSCWMFLSILLIGALRVLRLRIRGPFGLRGLLGRVGMVRIVLGILRFFVSFVEYLSCQRKRTISYKHFYGRIRDTCRRGLGLYYIQYP